MAGLVTSIHLVTGQTMLYMGSRHVPIIKFEICMAGSTNLPFFPDCVKHSVASANDDSCCCEQHWNPPVIHGLLGHDMTA